ncbi:hypothetical protein [Chromohalobacter canadensis]|uniref:Uncharacterized protein n=1 Tax=Chromohalobacter canadensis TaxID=141389 RepID=A0ABZ0YB20_9GAMM|nr:hypothetical protein [Chromohalobacter canadensis]MCK0770251.1 hypothetical protein [Chromohalobacter canadensis]WQH08928.1 hypothetical protein SR908_15890 [Chromohalobacter canadensis]
MNLFRQQYFFWPWFFQVMRAFFNTRPLTTAAVVILNAIGQVTSMLSTLLPLKVILLAGSDGVPRYFQFFIPLDEKSVWIAILSAGTVGLFITTSIIESASRKLAQSASSEILESANEITVIADQGEKATSYFSSFCSIVSYSAFILLVLIVLYWVNFNLLVFLLLALAVEFSFSVWAISGADDINPGKLKSTVLYKLGTYLSILKTINFLIGFFVIIYPFLVGQGYNVLFAIVSIILIRQALNMLSSLLSSCVALAKSRHRINTLVFREHQLEDREHRYSKALRDLFENKNREIMAARQFEFSDEDVHVTSEWMDSTIPAVKTFKINIENEGKTEYYQQQVYPPNRLSNLENEAFLFSHVARERLMAPQIHSRFSVGTFECQICEFGDAVTLEGDSWREWEPKLFERIWACQPPKSLIDAYSASHKVLHKRFSDEFLSRASIAIDSGEEKTVLTTFRYHLKAIVKYLSELPVYVHNPDANRANVISSNGGEDVLVMTWGRWEILPIGSVIPGSFSDDLLTPLLDEVCTKRGDINSNLSAGDLRYANACYLMERAIRGERYKAALENMNFVLHFLQLPYIVSER